MKTPLIRLVLAVSLDGRLAFPSGAATHLGREGDRQFLEKSLAWADGTLIGGGTLRAHKNTCLIHNQELIKTRISEGRSKQPTAIVISRQPKFCNSWPFFQQPIQRWLISPEEISRKYSVRSYRISMLKLTNYIKLNNYHNYI